MERNERAPSNEPPAIAEPARAAAETAASATSEAERRSHFRQTVEHAVAALHASRALHARSIASLARAEALVARSDVARRQSTAVRTELRTAVAAFAHLLRADGISPEAMVVEVKDVVRDATPIDLEPRAARALLEDAVRWGIEAYYDAA